MSQKSNFSVSKRVVQKKNKKAILAFQDLKIEDNLESVSKTIQDLKKKGCDYFKVVDRKSSTETVYKKLKNSTNYVVKTVAIKIKKT